MFTGLIQQLGTVAEVLRHSATARLVARAPGIGGRIKMGDSVAVNGVCLTAVEISADTFAADLGAETLRLTTLSRLSSGSIVNLELPLRSGDPMGGHVVQGHIDGIGKLMQLAKVEGAEDWLLELEIPQRLTRYVAAKGSIAIEGISLTVAEISGSLVAVSIIPHTYEATNLRSLKPGDELNIEVDIAAKYAEKTQSSSGLREDGPSLEKFIAEGF